MTAQTLTIDLEGRAAQAVHLVHDSGAGPGIVMLGDALDDALRARAALFAEEGYSVLALEAGSVSETVAAAAFLKQADATLGDIAGVGFGPGGTVLCAAARAAGLGAVVMFDPPDPVEAADALAGLPCPVVVQAGTRDGGPDFAALEGALDVANGSRVFLWPDVGAGFSLPGQANFDGRVDSLAHSRTLELLRRVQGPYYDYVALFAEHIRHEFETRDVDATMATMIDDPYVNHVATLAGGVGHDMLKRFYKYHFVEQNSADRQSVTVSHTLGPDRVVLELVVRFKHDQVLDRYFPGIPPTQEYVELATVLIVKFRGDKVCHEHIYWDQGSALKQIGVLETGDLPVAGAEAARKVLDEHRPSNIFMQDAWATSADKPL